MSLGDHVTAFRSALTAANQVGQVSTLRVDASGIEVIFAVGSDAPAETEAKGLEELLGTLNEEAFGLPERDEWGHTAIRPDEEAFEAGAAAVREAAKARREMMPAEEE